MLESLNKFGSIYPHKNITKNLKITMLYVKQSKLFPETLDELEAEKTRLEKELEALNKAGEAEDFILQFKLSHMCDCNTYLNRLDTLKLSEEIEVSIVAFISKLKKETAHGLDDLKKVTREYSINQKAKCESQLSLINYQLKKYYPEKYDSELSCATCGTPLAE